MEPSMVSRLTLGKSQSPRDGCKRPAQSGPRYLSGLASRYALLSSLCSGQTALLHCSWGRTGPFLPQDFVRASSPPWVTLPLDVLPAPSSLWDLSGTVTISARLSQTPLKMSSPPPRPRSYSSFITSFFSLAHIKSCTLLYLECTKADSCLFAAGLCLAQSRPEINTSLINGWINFFFFWISTLERLDSN